MSDYRIQIGTELNTKGIDTTLKKYQGKLIEIKSKLNTSGIDKKLASYKAKKPIEVNAKLNTTGLAKKIGEYKPKTPIKINAKLDTKNINAAISNYKAKKAIELNVKLNHSAISQQIKNYKAKNSITLNTKLNNSEITRQIKSYKAKTPINLSVKLTTKDIDEKIRTYKAKTSIKLDAKINKEFINEQIKTFKPRSTIYLKAKLKKGEIAEEIRNYKPSTPVAVTADFKVGRTQGVDTKITSYKNTPVDVPVRLMPAKTGFSDKITNKPVKVSATVDKDDIRKDIETAIGGYTPTAKMPVNIKLTMPKDINSQVKGLGKPTEPINVGVKLLDEDKINADIALFKPTATLGIQPDLILENVDDQIRAYVPKAKIKVNVELNNADIQNLTTKNTDRAYNTVSGGSYVSNAVQDLKEVDITIKATKNQITNLGKALKAVGFNNSSVKSMTNDFKELGVTVTKVTSKLNSDGSVRLTVKGLDQFKDAVTYVNNIGSDGKPGTWSETVSRDANKVIENFNRLKSIAKDIGNLKIDIFKSDDANEVKRMTDELNRLQKEYNKLFAGTQGGLNGNQINQLNNIAKNAEGALSKLKKEYAETRAELAKGIKGNFSGYDAQVQILMEKFEMLSAEMPDVEAAINRVKQALTDMRVAAKAGDDNALIESEQRYQGELEKTAALLKQNQSIERQGDYKETFATKKEAAQIKLNGLLEKGSNAAKKYGAEVRILNEELNKVGNLSALKVIDQKIANLDKKIKAEGLQRKTWGTRLKEQLSKYTQYLSIASVFIYGMQAARSMFEQVKAIDTAMTELRKVTDETNASYDKFLTNAASRAKAIGTTIDGLVSSTADFARLGYGFEDAQGLAEVANIYAVVGDEIEDVETASQSLISTMAAFKDEMNGLSNSDFALSIVDKFNEVSNNFSISSGGIGEALTRSASSLAAANNTLDESISLITAANTVVQDPAIVGTAFKTISMRIRGAKTELEDAGLETEGMVESTSKLREEILALSGVDIMASATEFKSTYQILDELSDKWKDLTDIQQASITELIAGKRQGNIISSLMANFDTARDVLKTSAESAGSAMAEHEKYMKSIEARLNTLKASWQSLSQSFLSSNFLKGAINGITKLVNALDWLMDKVGALPTILSSVAAGISLFKKDGGLFTFDKDTKRIKLLGDTFKDLKDKYSSISAKIAKYNSLNAQHQAQFCAAMQNSNTAFGKYIAGLNGGKASVKDYAASLVGAKIKTIALTTATALLNAALTMGVSLLIDFAISGIMKLVNAKKELAEKVEEVTSKFKEQTEELNKNKSSFGTLAKRFAELSKGVDSNNKNISLTTDEYAEYLSIVNDVANQVPSLVKGYDSQGNAILEVTDGVKGLTVAYEKLIEAQNNELLNPGKDGTGIEDIEKDFKNKMGKLAVNTNSMEFLESALNGKYSKDKIIEKSIDDYKGSLWDIIKALQVEGLAKDVHWYNSQGAWADAIAKAIEADPDKVREIINNFKSDVEGASDEIRTAAQAALSNAIDFSFSDHYDMGNQLKTIAQQVVGGLSSKDWKEVLDSGVSVEDYVNSIVDSLAKLEETGDSKTFEAAFNLETQFNNGEVNYGEYIKGIREAGQSIDELVSDGKIESRIGNQIKLSLNIDEITEKYDALKNRLTSKEFGIQLNTDSAENFLKNLSASEVQVAVDFIESDNADFKSALQNYKKVFDEAKKAGVDFSKTVFGNIDTNARQILEWTDANLNKYKDELMSWEPKDANWDKVKKEYEDTISTVMGTVRSYEIDGKEVDIAFSPMLQTDEGAKVLSVGVVDTYINELISKATKDGKWDKTELITLDAKGLEVDGQKIKGILADIGETALATSEQMHFVGKDGALAQAESTIDAIVEKQAKLLDATNFTISIDAETKGIETLNTALAESVSATGLSSESIEALKARYADLASEGYNLSAMFEETSNGIHLNKAAVSELEQAYASDKLSETNDKLATLKNRYDELTTEIDNCTRASDRADLYKEQRTIIQKINDLATLASQYEGLASAYNAWQNVESAGSERDMYEGILEGFENISDELSRGWTDDGTIKFLELLSGKTDLAGKSGKELKEIYDDLDESIKNTGYSVRDFFTVDNEGNSTSKGVYNFLDAVNKLEKEVFGGKDVVKKDKNGNIIGFDFELVAKKDKNGNVIKNGDQVIAEALGISKELVQIMVRASDDAGFVINMEGAYTQLADLKNEAEAAKDSLIELQKTGSAETQKKLKGIDLNFNLDAKDKDLITEQEKVVKLLDKFKKDGKVDLKMEGAQEALDIAEYLTIKLDDLTEPRFMQIDTSKIEDEDIQGALEQIQEIGDLCKDKHLISLEGDKEELKKTQDEIDEISNKLYALENNTKKKVGIDVNWDAKKIADKIEKGEIEIPAKLELDVQMSDDLKDIRLLMMGQLGITDENEVKLKVVYDIDDSVVDDLTPEKQEVVVNYLVNDEDVKNYTPEQKEALVKYIADGGNLDGFTPEEKEAFVNYLVDGGSVEGYTPEDKKALAKYLVDGGDPADYQPPSKIQNIKAELDSSEPDDYQPKDKKFTVKAILQKVGDWWDGLLNGGSKKSVVNGTANVDGTAFINGTTGHAFKRGNWGIKDSGTALVGELGAETLVRDGRYYTIGDTGAEFIRYKKGDIIFNHKQTEELFKNGKVDSGGGRGKAFVEGTAFAGGSYGKGGGDKPSKNRVTGQSYTSSSSDSKNKDKDEDFEETLDWIETKISRIERVIDKLDQKAGNIYKSWTSRNKALSEQISKIKDEIVIQQKAYDKYMSAASNVGLSSSYAEKVRNGKIDIETIKDETLKEKIEDYQKYYEKALDCKDAIEELRETESKLYAQRFENIQAQYDGILQGYEHTETMLNEYISQAEEQGHIVSKKYYQALINNEKQNISQLKKEQSALIKARDEAVDNGKIAKNSEEWYEMCAEIDSVTQAIEEGTTALLEYDNAMRQIDWDTFDLVQERISDITAESEFLIELMSNDKLFDDKGKLTKQGASTLGLHALNHNTAMYQSDEYGAEIARLDKEIAKDPYDQELINRRRELVELQRESILEAENQKQAIKDLVEEGINLELDALQERIDLHNEELNSMKNLYDYQKNVEEQTKNIASLHKQLGAYEGFDDEETRAKVQELKVSLEEAEADLKETEYDKFISDQTALLDTLYTDYETILNSRLDNIDFLLQQVIDGINIASGDEGAIATALSSEGAITQAIISAVGENGSIKNILNTEANNVGTTLSTAMNNIWSVGEGNAKSILTTYGTDFQSKLTTTNTVLNGIKVSIDRMVDDVDKDAQKKVTTNKTSTSAKKDPTKTVTTTTTKKKTSTTKTSTTKKKTTTKKSSGDGKAEVGDKVKFVSGQYYYDSQGKKPSGSHNLGKQVYITSINTKDWATYPYHISTGNKLGKGDLGWLKLNQLSGYASGKKRISNGQYAWTQENGQEYIIRPSDGAILTPVAKGDSILNAAASGNIWSMANNPAEFIKDNLGLDNTNIPNSANVNNTYSQHIDNVVFRMDNVKNYEEMLYALKDDRRFEKLVTAMTIDRIAGKSSLAKGKSIR